MVPVMLDLAIPYMHKEVNAKGPTKSLDARSDDENHRSSSHHRLMIHLSEALNKNYSIHNLI